MISPYTARLRTDVLWARKYDPDAYALPIHSAMMDLVGQILLAVCYELILAVFGDID
jgi:solute carrier family 41